MPWAFDGNQKLLEEDDFGAQESRPLTGLVDR
jgi:hypothetical protein